MGKHSKIKGRDFGQRYGSSGEDHKEIPVESNNTWKFLFLCVLIGVIIAAAGLIYIYKVTPKEIRSSVVGTFNFLTKPGETVFKDTDSVNILCLGLDYNYTTRGIMFSKYARTDTIFVVNVNKNGQINILSIPRDMRVDIAGDDYGYDKINTAYALGEEPLAQKTVEDFLGLKIDYYAIIRIKGTKELIDALGGITLDVEKDIDYDDNWGNTHIHLKKGLQVLNGEQAVGYSRFRYDEEGDRGRIRRQHEVLRALIQQLKDPKNITKANRVVKVLKDNIETNITLTQLVDLARLYKNFSPQNVHTDRLEGSDADIGGISYMMPDEREKEIKVNRMFKGITEYMPNEISLNIYNGTEHAGVAHKLAEKFSKEGYVVEKTGDYKDIDKTATTVLATQIRIKRQDKKGAASRVAELIGAAEVVDAFEDGAKVDFEIIIGEDLAKELKKGE